MQLEKDPDKEPNDPVRCVMEDNVELPESWNEFRGSSSEMELIEEFPFVEPRLRAKSFLEEFLLQEGFLPSCSRRAR